MRKITVIRRVSQIIFFIFILYGAYIFVDIYKIENKPLRYKNTIYSQPLQFYLPIKSCKFAGETGAFRGCFLYLFCDALSAGLNPLKKFLPHFLVFLFLAFIFGRVWCGWVCPIGFLSEIFSEVRKFLGLGRIKFSPNLRKNIEITSYVLLTLIILISIIVSLPQLPWNTIRKPFYLIGCQMCPSRIITPLITGFPLIISLYSPILVATFILCIIFTSIYLSSFLFKRAWCKLCSLGVLLSFFNKGAILTKEKDSLKCSRCGVCADACPMETKITYEEKKKKNIDHSQCIHCFRCVDLCPERNCLKVKFANIVVFSS